MSRGWWNGCWRRGPWCIALACQTISLSPKRVSFVSQIKPRYPLSVLNTIHELATTNKTEELHTRRVTTPMPSQDLPSLSAPAHRDDIFCSQVSNRGQTMAIECNAVDGSHSVFAGQLSSFAYPLAPCQTKFYFSCNVKMPDIGQIEQP